MTWSNFGKGLVVVVGAITLTMVTLRASDKKLTPETCPDDMVIVENSQTLTCADRFEASPSALCPTADVNTAIDSNRNFLAESCVAESREGVVPWRFVSREQAMTLCARAGKRLPTAAEWYELAVGSNLSRCQLSGGIRAAKVSDCASPSGVYDLVGNVWEWVSDDINAGEWASRSLPVSGYVDQVDKNGVASLSTTTPSELFAADYIWTSNTGVLGMVRGGFFGSGEDGGLYSVQANIAPTFQSAGIGFRCVK